MLSYEISRIAGKEGLPANSISLRFFGSAGQSFMAFGAKGISARVEGEVNDFCGKGLSGASIVVVPAESCGLVPELNIIAGNVCLYGATSGALFMRGIAGERFAVRNSGAYAVVEGVGDHGCEYMTGGRVVVLGLTGRNFAAGMSGGVAYVFNQDGMFASRVNHEMIELVTIDSAKDSDEVYGLIHTHLQLTGSSRAAQLLNDWETSRAHLIKIVPKAYVEAREQEKYGYFLKYRQQKTPIFLDNEPGQGGING